MKQRIQSECKHPSWWSKEYNLSVNTHPGEAENKLSANANPYAAKITKWVEIIPQSHCPESTPEWGRMDNSVWFEWSFLFIRAMTMTMTIDSNSVLLVRVASAGQYEVFEHVQKVWVPSTNNLHSFLCTLRTCSYRVCRTTYVLYSSRFSLYTMLFVHVHFIRTECECDLIEKKRIESSSYYFRTIREMFENDSHCHLH